MDDTSHLSMFNSLNGARIEGRLETVTQRQKEIHKLHQAIQGSEKELVHALRNDLGWNQVDGLLELTTVLQALRILYGSLDIKKSLADEHLISVTKKALARRIPLGNVLILAVAAAPIAQSVIPLCLAIAEGNTAMVVLSRGAPETSVKLLEIINENTDRDAIVAINPQGPSELSSLLSSLGKFAWQCIITQSPANRAEIESLDFRQSSPSVQILYWPPSSSTVIVTRNANIRKAATEVVAAKFSFFAGRSMTAPGLVLVDEFVLDEFLGILESCIRGLIAGRPPGMKARKHILQPETSQALDHFVKVGGGNGARAIQIFPDTSAETVLIGPQIWSKENFPNLQRDGAGQTFGYFDPVLPIQPTTSMEAAIKIANELNEDGSPSSVYLFSNPSEARYLSLFTQSSSKYINHISLEASLGPYSPSSILTLTPLLARTCFIQPALSSLTHSTAEQLQQAFSSGKGKIAGLKDIILQELAPPKQRSGFQVGFFPQGAMVGLSHVLLLLGLSVTGIVWSLKRAFRG